MAVESKSFLQLISSVALIVRVSVTSPFTSAVTIPNFLDF